MEILVVAAFLGLPLIAALLGLAAALALTRNPLDHSFDEMESYELLQFVTREKDISEYAIFERAFRMNDRPHSTHIDNAFSQYLRTLRVPTFVREYALQLIKNGELEA